MGGAVLEKYGNSSLLSKDLEWPLTGMRQTREGRVHGRHLSADVNLAGDNVGKVLGAMKPGDAIKEFREGQSGRSPSSDPTDLTCSGVRRMGWYKGDKQPTRWRETEGDHGLTAMSEQRRREQSCILKRASERDK